MDEDAIALRLGWLVIWSARVELEVKEVAEFLGEPDAGRMSQLKQIQAIRRLSQARDDGTEMREWAEAANALLRERGELVHSGFIGRQVGDEFVPAYLPRKRNDVINLDWEALDNLIATAAHLATVGHRFAARAFGEFIDRMGGEYHQE